MQKFVSGVAAIVAMAAIARAQGPAPSPLVPQVSPAPAESPAPLQPTVPAVLTKADLEPFLDALIPSQLRNRNIAGAVVAIVKDGQVLLAKGYGYADFAAKKPVLADQTLFRPGSISKLFTTTAVMQLVEQGKLDLDGDVSEYLDFAIPKTYPEPVTLRRLLTHTAGFEETLKNLFVPSEDAMKPLRDYLVATMPVRIFPPGKVVSYSNYGFALAGYLVERASGEKFERYIDNHILKPLGMLNSTFDQPLPAPLQSKMSQGYLIATKKPRDFEFVQAAPAGSLSTTATDMTRFMLAFLQGGIADGVTILKPQTVRLMESRQFELHPALNGLGFNFMEYSTDSPRIIGHGGDTLYFHSDMWLCPEARLGFFISYNSAGSKSGGGRGEVMRAFSNRYFPAPPEPKIEIHPDAAKMDGRSVSGVYEGTRRGETNFLKIAALLGQFSVRSNADGVLTIEGMKNQRNELKQWREMAPLVYGEIDGPEKIAFRSDVSGTVSEMLPFPAIYEGQRVSWYASKVFLQPLIGGSLLLALLTVVLWPVAVLVRKRYQRPLFVHRSDRLLYFVSRIVCLGEILFIVVPAIVFSRALENIGLLGDGIDPWLRIFRVFGWLTMVGVLLLVIAAVRFTRLTELGHWFRIHAILLAMGGMAFGWFCWQYHLLDPSLKF